MRDHELRSLLNLVDEPTEPPAEYVESLWAELEATLTGEAEASAVKARRPRHVWAYLTVAAMAVMVLGVLAAVVVGGSGSTPPQPVAVTPEAPTPPAEVAETASDNPACDLFVADGDLGVVWRTGVVSSGDTGYTIESDASAAQLSGSAEAVDEMAARVASGDTASRHVAGQLERVSVDLGRASLLMRFDERALAQKAIERARAALVGLAFEPGLDECIDTDSWAG